MILESIGQTLRRLQRHRIHGLDPFAWLHDVLTRLPTWSVRRFHELTPAACAKAARTATPQGA